MKSKVERIIEQIYELYSDTKVSRQITLSYLEAILDETKTRIDVLREGIKHSEK